MTTDSGTDSGTQRVGTVVVGGSQAGLVMGHHLRRAGEDFVILEGAHRVGDAWRNRWDSLRLFSTPRYASLPGWRIPTRTFPTRDEMADYLEQYAQRFELPIRTSTQVQRVSRARTGFRVETSTGTYVADRVVVATGAHQRARTPALAAELDPKIRQLHSIDYRNPRQLAPGGVLVVGAANSGSDVALDAAAAGHQTWLAGRHPGQVPVDIDAPRTRPVVPVIMFVFRHVLTLRTPMGRKAQRHHQEHGVNLVRNKLADLDAAGITRLGRISQVRDGRPAAEDGVALDISTVVWCTGSDPDHSFLDLPAFAADGRPLHDRGVSPEPGLYYLGLEFQFAMASATIQGLDRDARFLMRRMRRAPKPSARELADSTR
jgi:putative flavoprotein involved in K+ transport